MTSLSQDQINAYGQTDQGLMRSDNEDSLLVDMKHSVFAVADGLGGLPEGSMASELAIEALAAMLKKHKVGTPLDFPKLFSSINERVYEKGREISYDVGIGTTLTIAQVHEGILRIGHVGDSGAVVFNNRSWRQLTRDHTMAQDMLERLRPGEHAYIPEYFSHTLTRCIGQMTRLECDVYTYELELGERLMLFSDGVTKTMNLDEVHESILRATSPEAFVSQIIDTANERGGPDNITAIAIFFE